MQWLCASRWWTGFWSKQYVEGDGAQLLWQMQPWGLNCMGACHHSHFQACGMSRHKSTHTQQGTIRLRLNVPHSHMPSFALFCLVFSLIPSRGTSSNLWALFLHSVGFFNNINLPACPIHLHEDICTKCFMPFASSCQALPLKLAQYVQKNFVFVWIWFHRRSFSFFRAGLNCICLHSRLPSASLY